MNKYAPLLLFLVALMPRVVAPGEFLTVDEAYHWFERAGLFLEALQRGDFMATNIIGHPGVTTMWLGALGVLAHQAAVQASWVDAADMMAYYHFLRFPVGVATALCIALAFPLLCRLFGARVAWLATLLWAADPFLVAHSKVLHVDALLASFMTLSLLAALVAAGIGTGHNQRINWPMLGASAVAGGLAFLTKSPSVLLPPMVGLIMLVALERRRRAEAKTRGGEDARRRGGEGAGTRGGEDAGRRRRGEAKTRRGEDAGRRRRGEAGGRGTLLIVLQAALAVWGGIALAVWFLLWPAAWVDPAGTAGRMMAQVVYEGGEPHGWGNFFLGRAVEAPGPLFYPVAVALRLTPWTLIGVLAALPLLRPRNRSKPDYAALVLLSLFVLLFAAMITLPPKKFDRYALPIFPALDILAALGLLQLWDWGASLRYRLAARLGAVPLRVLPLALTLLLAGNLAWYHPYELAYYNPLLGGGAVAARLVPVGWGEGLAQAGRYIRRQVHGCDYPVASWFQPVLEPFACTPVLHLSEAASAGRVDYAILYIDQVQRNNVPDVTTMLQQITPVHTVRIHGIAYAQVYQLPRPLAQASEANFGDVVRLHSYEVDSSALRTTGTLTLTTQWQARASMVQDYMLFVHLLDEQGRQYGQIDVPPGGPQAPTSTWQPGHYVTWYHPLPVPPGLPAGRYWLSLGIYDLHDFSRLPLQAAEPPDAPDDGANALLLEPIEIR
jgi:4-amino-4-deoxy-L-arabinose transferase-like glycosyltransferase